MRRLFVCMLFAAVLAACGSSSSQTPPSQSSNTTPGGETTPSSASGKLSFMIWGDPAEKAAYEQLVAAFQQKQPNIKVEVVYIPTEADYRKRLTADIAAGTAADVVLLNYRRMSSFLSKGALEPVGPYMAKSSVLNIKDFYNEAVRPFTVNGQLICMPQNISSLVVYYNKALFDAANQPYPKNDWTWDDFVATAKALTKDTNGDGTPDQYGLGTDVQVIRLAPFIWQNGGTLVDNDELPTSLTLDNPSTREAIQWFVDLQVTHKVVPDAVQEEAEDSQTRFINGRLGMFLNSRRVVPTLREISGFDWDVAPLPRRAQPASVLHSDGYCITAGSKQKDAAWTLVEFANSKEGQTIIAKTGRTVPSNKEVSHSPVFLDPQVKPASSQVFLDVIPAIRPVPLMDDWVAIEDRVGEELKRAYYGQASVDEAISAAMSKTREFFKP